MFKYTTIPSFLSKIECERIVSIFTKNFELVAGSINVDPIINKEPRDSNIAMSSIDMFPIIKEKLQSKLKDIIKIKGYELNFENQLIQFTEYKKDGHYDWHTDAPKEGAFSERFCSMVIQLTDEYTGGELLLKDFDENIKEEIDITLEKGLGNLFVFLSSTEHKVAPVINGNRYSLVSWFALKPLINFEKTLI
jgi:predicted 2-oxoglutarate/Fe(II)-dependent dioxygenase YbiX